MKKILLIIIFLCIAFGTNNYKDLNSLAIITNIGIEKENNEYKVTFQEIVPKISEGKLTKKYNYYTNKSNNIKEAFKIIEDDITKDIYLEHLENVIIKTKDRKIINNLDNIIKGDLDNFNVILTSSNIKKVMSYRNDYNYVSKVIKDNTTLRTIKKNKLEKRQSKIPIVKINSEKLLFYKYIKLGDDNG